jgi:hypothetical protein
MISRCGSISKCGKASVNVFKHNNKWYKISIMVDDITTSSSTNAAKDLIDHRFS